MVQGRVCTPTCVCVVARKQPQGPLLRSHHFAETGSPAGSRSPARLADLPVTPGTCLSLHARAGLYVVPMFSSKNAGSRKQTHVLVPVWQVLFLLSRPPPAPETHISEWMGSGSRNEPHFAMMFRSRLLLSASWIASVPPRTANGGVEA